MTWTMDRLFRDTSPSVFRRFVNLAPFMRSSGARIVSISDDWRTWHLVLRRRLRNLNYVGTLFGGSLYASADPHFMLAWMKILGPEYVVWDKGATIRFRRPGRTRLEATFTIAQEEIDEVRRLCEENHSVDRAYLFEWKDPDGQVVTSIDKVVYFRKADPPVPKPTKPGGLASGASHTS